MQEYISTSVRPFQIHLNAILVAYSTKSSFHPSIVFSPNIPGSGVARLPTHRQILGEVPSSPPFELLLLHFDSSIWRQLISLQRLQLELSPTLLLRFVGRRPGQVRVEIWLNYDGFSSFLDVFCTMIHSKDPQGTNGAGWIMLNCCWLTVPNDSRMVRPLYKSHH